MDFPQEPIAVTMVPKIRAQEAVWQTVMAVLLATALVLPGFWEPTDLLQMVGPWQPYLQIPIMPGFVIVYFATFLFVGHSSVLWQQWVGAVICWAAYSWGIRYLLIKMTVTSERHERRSEI